MNWQETTLSPRWMNWVREVITLLGIAWQEEEPGVLRVVLKDEEARLFGLNRQQSLLWILDPGKIGTFPQAELVVPGSLRFTQLQEIARRRSRLARLFFDPANLPGISDTGSLTNTGRPGNVNAPPRNLRNSDSEWRLAPVAVLFLLIERVWRDGTGWSNLLLDVGVDLLTGATKANTWEGWRGLPWQETAPPWPPRERRQLTYRDAFRRATSAARQVLAELLVAHEPEWVGAEARKYEEAVDQVHRYFDGLAREERALRREQERQFHLEEVARRHRLTLDGRPVSLLLLLRPVLIQGSSAPASLSLPLRLPTAAVPHTGSPAAPASPGPSQPARPATHGQPAPRPTTQPSSPQILWDPLDLGVT